MRWSCNQLQNECGLEAYALCVSLHRRVLHGGQALERGLAGGDGDEAAHDVAAVGLDVQVGQGLNHRPLGGAQVAQGDGVVGQRSRLVAGPGVEGGHELGRLDQPGLQREQAEQEVAFGGHGHSPGGARGRRGDSHRGRRPVVVRSGGLIVMREGTRTPVYATGGGHDRSPGRRAWTSGIGSHGRGEGRPNSVGAAPNRARMTRSGLSSRCSRSGGSFAPCRGVLGGTTSIGGEGRAGIASTSTSRTDYFEPPKGTPVITSSSPGLAGPIFISPCTVTRVPSKSNTLSCGKLFNFSKPSSLTLVWLRSRCESLVKAHRCTSPAAGNASAVEIEQLQIDQICQVTQAGVANRRFAKV